MPRRNRRFVSSYMELAAPPIELPYTIANLEMLLAEGMRSNSLYTHQQIMRWADRFWWTQSEQPSELGIAVKDDIKHAARIAQEISMQWDMRLPNTYELAELQRLDFSLVRLPESLFAGWLTELRELSSPQESE